MGTHEITTQFFKLIQDRRKSRDDQKRDLALLENREDLWRNQLEDKNSEIAELNKRIGVGVVLIRS